MRNFIQFIVPILVIFVGGLLFYIYSKPIDASKKLYIKCDNVSEKKDIYSLLEIKFAEKNEKCKLDIKITAVESDYIKIDTFDKYLWNENPANKKENAVPRRENIISTNEINEFYSYDGTAKYIFEYK